MGHHFVERPALGQSLQHAFHTPLRVGDAVGRDRDDRVEARFFLLLPDRFAYPVEALGERVRLFRGQRKDEVPVRDLVVARLAGQRLQGP